MMGDHATDVMSLSLKAKGKGKSGLKIERRSDGHYYLKKKPQELSRGHVGDKILEINGVKCSSFKNEKHANSLIDMIQLKVQMNEDDEESDSDTSEEDNYEEIVRPRASKSAPANRRQDKKVAPTPRPANKKNTKANGVKPVEAKHRKKETKSAPKRGKGRREEVEYLSDSSDSKPAASKGPKKKLGGQEAKARVKTKAPPKKGRGRREIVEYLDDDDDSEDEDEDDYMEVQRGKKTPKQKKGRGEVQKPSRKEGRGRREVVEYLDDSDSDEDGEEYVEVKRGKKTPNGGKDRKAPSTQTSTKGRGRREVVEHLEDDSDEDDYVELQRDSKRNSKSRKPSEKSSTSRGRGRREVVEYLDDGSEEEEEDDDDDDDDYVEMQRGANNRSTRKTDSAAQSRQGREEEVEYMDKDYGEGEEFYEEVGRPHDVYTDHEVPYENYYDNRGSGRVSDEYPEFAISNPMYQEVSESDSESDDDSFAV